MEQTKIYKSTFDLYIKVTDINKKYNFRIPTCDIIGYHTREYGSECVFVIFLNGNNKEIEIWIKEDKQTLELEKLLDEIIDEKKEA